MERRTSGLILALVACCCIPACGDDAEDAPAGGCERMAEEDGRCAATPGTPALFVCEGQSVAPAQGCQGLGDSGDFCCPAGAAGAGGSGGSSGTGGAAGTSGTGGNTGGVAGSSATGGAAGTSGTGGVAGSSGAAAGSAGSSGAEWWHPTKGLSWDWQLGDASELELTHPVAVYDVDWEVPASVVSQLHADGKKVICYVSVGSYEEWRPDASEFPQDVLGNAYPGWQGERFVDIRSTAVRAIMSKRFDVCRSKGFDALEPDNQDVFEADSGFGLTAADGLAYAQWLAAEAHGRGLAIVQKNADSLASELVALYDGALSEDCYADQWCPAFSGYPLAGKPVFMCEYTDTNVDFAAACAFGKQNGFSPILKDRELTSSLQTCP